MKVSTMFPGRYLKASDLGGEDLTLTIEALAFEVVGSGDDAEDKPVLRFEDQQQGLVLNKTNAVTIAEMYGEDSDRWVGKPITLYATRCQMGAKMVDCLRIRLIEAKRETPVIADEGSSDSSPF